MKKKLAKISILEETGILKECECMKIIIDVISGKKIILSTRYSFQLTAKWITRSYDEEVPA